jgi:hypothetical protein
MDHDAQADFVCNYNGNKDLENLDIIDSPIESVWVVACYAQAVTKAKSDPTVRFICDPTRAECLVPKAYYLRAVQL